MGYGADFEYRIGYAADNTISLDSMGLAPPDQVVYRPATLYYVRGDFTRVGDGFAAADWVWDTIGLSKLSLLLSFLADEDSAEVYIQTDKREGLSPNPKASFGIFRCIMWKPILSGEDGVHVVRTPYVLQTVRVQFRRLIEIIPGP
jgi:hypothetical protein